MDPMNFLAVRLTACLTILSKDGFLSESFSQSFANGKLRLVYMSRSCQSYSCRSGMARGFTHLCKVSPLSSQVPSNLKEKFCLCGQSSRTPSSPNTAEKMSSPRMSPATFLKSANLGLASDENRPRQVVFFSLIGSTSPAAFKICTAGSMYFSRLLTKSLSVYAAFSSTGSSSGPVKTLYAQLKEHSAPKRLASFLSSRASSTAKASFFHLGSFFPFPFAVFAALTNDSS
mmetsp:Transcript_44310/g.77758  ORF Transcript_44310/g.77758 Transcript_44310/m.77758 type:complete len:230 (+) Transcript_44310:874-1563(+)